MKSCETKESMKYEMRPVIRAMATAALGTAIVWAGIVTRLATEHELATTILFSASIPCLVASAVFSAIAAVRLGKPPESRPTGKTSEGDERHPGSPQDPDVGSRLSRTPAPTPLKPARRPVGPSLRGQWTGHLSTPVKSACGKSLLDR